AKASLVLAGLPPQLRVGSLPDSQSWVYLNPIVPGNHPLESLALTFAAHLPDRTLQTLREDLESDSARGLHLLASLLTKEREVRVVLFVEQFEEVFNSSTSEEERQQFIDLLVTAMTELCGPVMVVLRLGAC